MPEKKPLTFEEMMQGAQQFGMLPTPPSFQNQFTIPGAEPPRTIAPSERQIAPGIVAVGTPPQQTAPTPQQPVTPGSQLNTNEILGKISDPNNPMRRVKFPDGTEIEGDFVAPQPLGTLEPRQPQPQPFATVASPSQVSSQAQPQQGGGLRQFISSPTFRYILGRAAGAIAGGDQNAIGTQLGNLGAELAQSQAFANYLKRLQAGEDPATISGNDVDILLPELRQEALAITQRQQQLGIEGQRANTEQQRADTYSELAQAEIAGSLTAAQKIELDELQRATQLEIGKMNNRFMRVNETVVLNTETGDIIQVPGGRTEMMFSMGNLKDADFERFNSRVAAEFLNDAKSELIKTLPEGTDEIQAMVAQFDLDPETGAVNWQKVFSYLPPEKQTEFAQALSQYTINAGKGIPDVFTFQQRVTNRNQPAQPGQEPGTAKPKVVF